MKKLLMLLLLGLISCQGCSKNSGIVPAQSATVTPTIIKSIDPIDQEISLNDMTVTFSLDWLKQEEDSDSMTLINKSKKILVLMSKEECASSTSLCMLGALHSLSQAGVEILTAEELTINGNKATLVISRKDQVKIWSWVIHTHNIMYMFTCGGLEGDESNQDICKAIATSIKIK